MSMARCSACDAFTDTDDDVEGVFEGAQPFGFFCSSCVEDAPDDPAARENPRILAAVKASDPQRYNEMMEQ